MRKRERSLFSSPRLRLFSRSAQALIDRSLGAEPSGDVEAIFKVTDAGALSPFSPSLISARESSGEKTPGLLAHPSVSSAVLDESASAVHLRAVLLHLAKVCSMRGCNEDTAIPTLRRAIAGLRCARALPFGLPAHPLSRVQ